jgi:hypothetical protein
MRTVVVFDERLLMAARELTGVEDISPLVRTALKALVERESARRLVSLGGTEPQLKPPLRRRGR